MKSNLRLISKLWEQYPRTVFLVTMAGDFGACFIQDADKHIFVGREFVQVERAQKGNDRESRMGYNKIVPRKVQRN